MRFFSWFFFLLVLGLVGFLAYKVKHGTQGDPDLLVAEAQRLAGGADPDKPGAIEKLNFALRIAQSDPLANHDRIGGILAARGALFADEDMGQFAQARIDLERVLKDYRPGDPDVQLDLAQVFLETEEQRAALDLTQDVLARDPRRADAWTLQARVLVALADELLGEAAELCEDALPDRAEYRAAQVLDRITSLEPGSLARVDYLYQLRDLFGTREQGKLSDVLRLAEEASDYVREARTALAESFREEPTPQALADFAGLLRRAGRRDLAIDFGLAVINRSSVNRSVRFVHDLLDDLLAAGRPHTGVDMINQYYARDVLPDPAFYASWTRALYEDEQWGSLVFVAQSMRNSSSEEVQRHTADLYLGLAHVEQEQYFEAPASLTKFINSATPEPFPGARVTAGVALARCYRELGQDNQEKAALRGALRDMPDEHPEAGRSWLRLSQLITLTEPGSGTEMYEALTNAVRLQPELQDELLPHWRELGESRLLESRTNLTLVYQTLRASGLLVPEGQVEPYLLWRLAELYRDDGEVSGVVGCARKFLLRYPGFLPMLDLYIETARDIGDRELLARLLFERLKHVGADPATVEELAGLPANVLTRETQTALMRLDPERTGRLALVRDLKEQGRALEALAGLNLVPADQFGDEARLLQAQLAHDLGRWGLAEQALEPIQPDSPYYGTALELRLDLAVAMSSRKPLIELVEEVTARSNPDVPFLLETADHMMLAGLANYARLLLQKLDQNEATRNGEVMFKLGLASWFLESPGVAEDHIARAQAYLTDGAPELGWLIRAVDQRRWNELPWLVADLQTTGFKPTLLQSAILDVLREEPREAQALVARAAGDDPGEPLWAVLERAIDLMLSPRGAGPTVDQGPELDLDYLLVGLGGGDRDPRQLLVRMLAMQHPAWLVWATAEFEGTPAEEQGGSWATYLAGRCREDLGDLEKAEARARRVLDDHKEFIPAWDLLERVTLAAVPAPDHPRFVRVQLSRRRNLGERGELEPLDLYVAAQAKVDQELIEDAVALLEESLELDPEYVEALLLLARLREDQLRWRESLEAYSSALAAGADQTVLLPAYLAVLERAAAAQPDLLPVVLEHAENLVLRFPEDPRVALARARRELENGLSIPEVRLGRAYARLEEFRSSTSFRRLDELAPDSTRAWVDFYLGHDPSRALALVEKELERAPTSIDLWYMLGECQAALGLREEAIETLEFLQRMLPDARTTRALAHLLSENGRHTEQVTELATRTIQLERLRSRDVDLQLAVARSLVNNMATGARDGGIEMLQDLWSKRSRAEDEAQVAEIGELYGLALTWRADPKDRQTAHDVLTEIEPLIKDPVQRHLVRASANLALSMRRSARGS